MEAGKRLYIKINDRDFAILEPDEQVEVICQTRTGDREKVLCDTVGRNAKMTLGSIVTQLGRPEPGNGMIEVRGGDLITVSYLDRHTADRGTNEAAPQGSPRWWVTASHALRTEPTSMTSRPRSWASDSTSRSPMPITTSPRRPTAWRPPCRSTAARLPRRIDEEIAERVANGELEEAPEDGTLKDLIDPLKLVRSLPVQLRESAENGVFRLALPLQPGSGVPDALHADPGQVVRLVYLDKRHLGEGSLTRTAEARVIEGNLGRDASDPYRDFRRGTATQDQAPHRHRPYPGW